MENKRNMCEYHKIRFSFDSFDTPDAPDCPRLEAIIASSESYAFMPQTKKKSFSEYVINMKRFACHVNAELQNAL